MGATIRTARSFNSAGYRFLESPGMTPTFPTIGVSGQPGAAQFLLWDGPVLGGALAESVGVGAGSRFSVEFVGERGQGFEAEDRLDGELKEAG